MKHKTIASCLLSFFTAVSLFGAENAVPRQFRVWGRKAPEKLSPTPIPGKVGIASIPIPQGMTLVNPDTNLVLPAGAAEKYKACGMVPFPYHPQQFVYSVTAPTAQVVGKSAKSIATPDEYTQLGFAIYATQNLSCVDVTLSPFVNKAGKEIIPVICQDLRRMMDLPVPLLSDSKKYQIEPRYMESFDEFDALSIPAKRCERFFLTVKIPSDAPAGIVRSTVTLKSRGKAVCTQKLIIRILPFKLRQPNPETEMNFMMCSGINDCRYSRWGKDRQPHQALRQLADLAEHGMTGCCYEHANPYVTGTPDGKLTLDFERPGMSCYHSMNDFLFYVNKAGLTGPFCNYNGPWEWAQFMVPGVLKYPKFSNLYNGAIQQLVKGVEKQRKAQKWQKFIYIVGDEPAHSSERMELSANCGRQILKACPEVDVTNFFNGMHGGTKDWLLMRDAHTIVNANFYTAAVLAEVKKLGYKQIWNYNTVMWHPTDCRGLRIAYGFVPWSLGSSGITQYTLREYPGDDKHYENIAYDHIHFGSGHYDFTYPAADGPLPTPKWEAIRQGVYDYKYLYTLKKMLDESKNNPVAAEVKAELDAVVAEMPLDYHTSKRPEYLERFSPEVQDAWRWRITQGILKLMKASK